jgi:hypothetical protein
VTGTSGTLTSVFQNMLNATTNTRLAVLNSLPTQTASEPSCRVWFGETAGVRQATLENRLVRAEVLLAKGANVRQFWHVPTAARTLAETHDWVEQLRKFHRSGFAGGHYCESYEGGWQDVLPARARWAGGAIDSGEGVGEAAIVPWQVVRHRSSGASARLACRARLPRTGLDVLKQFEIRHGAAALRVTTTVTNPTSRDVRLSWTQHPALGGDVLDETSIVWLPGGRPCVRRTPDGRHVGAANEPGRPTSVTASALLPSVDEPDRFTTLADIDRAEAAVVSRARGVGVRLRWDAATFPHAWLWCARRDGICCVAVEPSSSDLRELLSPAARELMHRLPRGGSVCSWAELSVVTRADPTPPGSGPSLFDSPRS